jgi:hypothetical protein
VGEVEGYRSLEVLDLLRKRIRQPGQPSKLHPQAEVMPFHMGRANALGIWGAPSGQWNGVDDAGWRVALVWISWGGINLHVLCEVYTSD